MAEYRLSNVAKEGITDSMVEIMAINGMQDLKNIL
jgi:hypothetical protein